uniref:Aminopeptidase n=1 Tax=Periophthalmus magnuspinnatus TaxID=409849 RepID=A0A3B4BFX1_9GOBI
HSYNVTLWPHLSPNTENLYIFTGNTHNGPTWQEPAPSIKSTWLQPITQYMVIHLNGKLKAGHRYQLFSAFSGELADDLAGFYRSEYEEDGLKKVVATSQMHPTHARKTFPCFDEPALKAVFNITLIHPQGTVALSNGKEIGQSYEISKWAFTTRFESTEKMSSYLLAVIVCDFTFLSYIFVCFEIRIWARRKAIQSGQGNYALNVTGPILDFFQNYYNISYPLSKSDQIALPDFYFGAMENWGLVTYRETNLLYDPVGSSNRNKETTVTIIAHELAHMWFGNLVTLKWWNEVWLNEGFASYVSYLGKDMIVLDDIHRVFAVDALTSSHPLSSYEEDILKPEQISEQFDAISYSKGASVLRMLSDFLSEPVFVQGLSTYLTAFSYGNTIGSDLWQHLNMAGKNNNMSLPHHVGEIMNTWTLQMGFPVVTIDTATGNVTQTHFLLDPESNVTVKYTWLIPVRWMKAGVLQSNVWWFSKKTEMNSDMRSGGAWILANVNVTGYYRMNYDLGNWERLLIQLNTDHQVIPLINRAQIIDDAFNLARCADYMNVRLSSSLTLDIHANVRSVVYCSAIAAGAEREWDFGWSQFKSAAVASEASKLMSALACATKPELLQRYEYLSFTLNSTMIRKQDASAVITAVASNRVGQSMAWDFVREYGVGAFSFATIISGVTARFSTQAELQQVCPHWRRKIPQ